MTGGCLYLLLPLPERGKEASWSDFPQNYLKVELEEIDRNNLKLTDFVLKKDELEGKGLRLSRGYEKYIIKPEDLNPLRRSLDKFSLEKNTPIELQPEEEILADYVEQISYPL